MLSKVSLRLKLSDFINTDAEEQIMNKINDVHKELNISVLLYLWFDEGEIVGTDLKDFLMRWEDKLSFKTVVKQGSHIRTNNFVWFDIVPFNVESSSYKRFSYPYINKTQILKGLEEFYNVTKFVISDKTFKKQKRNDYED